MAFDWGTFIGSNLGQVFKDIVGAFKVDPTVALQVQERLAEAQLALQGKILDQVNEQLQVNLAEAQSKSLFVAGWRPFVGWVCGSAFAWCFVVQPLLTFALVAGGHPLQLPALDLSQMMPVLLGMLGLGALRTYEKVQGTPNSDKLQ